MHKLVTIWPIIWKALFPILKIFTRRTFSTFEVPFPFNWKLEMKETQRINSESLLTLLEFGSWVINKVLFF